MKERWGILHLPTIGGRGNGGKYPPALHNEIEPNGRSNNREKEKPEQEEPDYEDEDVEFDEPDSDSAANDTIKTVLDNYGRRLNLPSDARAVTVFNWLLQ